MEDRIRKFIEFKEISPSELADEIGVQRSNVTHVLKARNKPSFQFIEKLLHAYPELSAKWLLLGTGNMIDSSVKVARTLFDAVPEPTAPVISAETDELKDVRHAEKQEVIQHTRESEQSKSFDKVPETVENRTTEIREEFSNSEKPIERLIVFFKDQTFKVYYPSR